MTLLNEDEATELISENVYKSFGDYFRCVILQCYLL